jgi:hypothetical protein
MSLADEIRNSFILPQSFFDDIVKDLRRGGSTSVICDHHISDIKNYAIPFQYGNSLESWARENGFSVSYKYNSYGVRHIFISI